MRKNVFGALILGVVSCTFTGCGSSKEIGLNGQWLRSDNQPQEFCEASFPPTAAPCKAVLVISGDSGSYNFSYNACPDNTSPSHPKGITITKDESKKTIEFVTENPTDSNSDCFYIRNDSDYWTFDVSGTYVVNGDTLTITPASGDAITFTRQ